MGKLIFNPNKLLITLTARKLKRTIIKPSKAKVKIPFAFLRFSGVPPEVIQVKAPSKSITRKITTTPISKKGMTMLIRLAISPNFAGVNEALFMMEVGVGIILQY